MPGEFIQVRHLTKTFPVAQGMFNRRPMALHAVNDVTFPLHSGEVLGLVGESGCGKSTLARMLMGLIEPDSGDILMDGRPLRPLSEGPRPFQMVFQDPFSSLDPRMRIGSSVIEPLLPLRLSVRENRARMLKALDEVGLDASAAERYPHQFSGGQRQRIAIVRALITDPRLVVCDEAVSALDASVRAQVLNLLEDRRAASGFAMLFISHDLAVVGHVADRIAVMYLGAIVEMARRDELLGGPLHPYAEMLLSNVLMLDGAAARVSPWHGVACGEPPSPLRPPRGCPFHPRCPYVTDACREIRPELRSVGSGRMVACHRY